MQEGSLLLCASAGVYVCDHEAVTGYVGCPCVWPCVHAGVWVCAVCPHCSPSPVPKAEQRGWPWRGHKQQQHHGLSCFRDQPGRWGQLPRLPRDPQRTGHHRLWPQLLPSLPHPLPGDHQPGPRGAPDLPTLQGALPSRELPAQLAAGQRGGEHRASQAGVPDGLRRGRRLPRARGEGLLLLRGRWDAAMRGVPGGLGAPRPHRALPGGRSGALPGTKGKLRGFRGWVSDGTRLQEAERRDG